MAEIPQSKQDAEPHPDPPAPTQSQTQTLLLGQHITISVEGEQPLSGEIFYFSE